MARRKKHSGKKRHYGRRMSGVNKNGIFGEMETLVGVVVGSVLSTVVQKQFTSLNPKIISVGQIVAGVFATKQKSPIVIGIGWGMASAGAIGLTHEVGILHGLNEMVSGMYEALPEGNDYYQLPATHMNGISNSARMAGMSNSGRMSGSGDNDDMNEDDGLRPM